MEKSTKGRRAHIGRTRGFAEGDIGLEMLQDKIASPFHSVKRYRAEIRFITRRTENPGLILAGLRSEELQRLQQASQPSGTVKKKNTPETRLDRPGTGGRKSQSTNGFLSELTDLGELGKSEELT
jgi:hypothetical protein